MILPSSISSKIWLISSIGRSVTLGTTLPSAANWKASCRSWRVPTSEPTTSIPSSTRRGIFRSMDSDGSPTATSRPPARKASTAELNAPLATAVTTAACAPPVLAWMTFAASSLSGLTTRSAPISLAKRSCSSLTSMAMTLALNTFLAYCRARLPRPPRP
ncbi:hypothetical protein D9M71_677080 [compost metagenome]